MKEEKKSSQEEINRFEVTELDDVDLDDVAGGGPNGNCGCGGYTFSGEAGAPNDNCGCPGDDGELS